MNAVIITIGDEILIGQVINTNAAWMGERLTGIGVKVVEMLTISDTESAITSALDAAIAEAELVLVTGGLGPTHDDLTKSVVAGYFGFELEYHAEIFDEIVRRFKARNIPVASTNKEQAMVPAGFEVLHNALGTAPGLYYAWQYKGESRQLVLLPGVPGEMKHIMEHHVFPTIADSDRTVSICQKTLLTTGIAESNLNEVIGNLSDLLTDELKLAYLPNAFGVRMRLTALSAQKESGYENLGRLEKRIREKAGKYIYGEGNDTLEKVVGDMLAERALSIATAESCTGGAVASRITDVPGSSRYVAGGIVAYNNDIKTSLLGVDPDVILNYGAVSRQVVTQMASGVRNKFATDIGVATSGIMGPDGGTESKPVGTVWIGISDANGENAALLQLTNERVRNKQRTVTALLNMIRIRLLRAA